MSKYKKNREMLNLQDLSKEDLVNRVIQLEARNLQLNNIVTKINNSSGSETQKKSKRNFDFAKCRKQHVMFKLLYLGWDYQGFACQEDTQETIEAHLFRALTKCCLIESRKTSNYHRCGRTDKGVSSFDQAISLTVRAAEIGEPDLEYCKMLNSLLPDSIQILAWAPVKEDFSARFDCQERMYKYFFPRGDLDIAVMTKAAELLAGTHDFRNLCKMDVGNGVTNFVRHISSASIDMIASSSLDTKNSGYDMYCLTVVGKAFLWHQIRCIVGILLLVGRGSEEPAIITELLDVRTFPRKPQYNLGLELPLNLYECRYESNLAWVVEKPAIMQVASALQKQWTLHSIKSTMTGCMLQRLCLLEPALATLRVQSRCLLHGVQPKVYQPLFSRPTCESLENRIEHYAKRRKIEKQIEKSDEEM